MNKPPVNNSQHHMTQKIASKVKLSVFKDLPCTDIYLPAMCLSVIYKMIVQSKILNGIR